MWFYGIPGAGKTILLSYMVEDVKLHCKTQSDKSSICIYYYCYFGRNQDESAHLVRWAVSQLARNTQYIPEGIVEILQKGEQPSLSALMDALSELSSRLNRVYLLIDALDESAPRAGLLRVLQQLGADRFSNIKVIATSREESDIKRALDDISLSVSLSNQYVDEDIATYVRSSVASNPRLRDYPVDLKEEIERALVEGARGMSVDCSISQCAPAPLLGQVN